MKKLLLIIPLLLSCSFNEPYYIPPQSYYMNMNYAELTQEIRYYEWKLQMENRKCHYYKYCSPNLIRFLELHLRKLYLYRNHIGIQYQYQF